MKKIVDPSNLREGHDWKERVIYLITSCFNCTVLFFKCITLTKFS